MILENLGVNDRYTLSGVLLAVCFLALPLFQGCTAAGGSVIAATGTTIGVEVSQNQTTQTPMAVLGYKRAELAYVPTNRGTANKTTTTFTETGKEATKIDEGGLQSLEGGAKGSANVLMELRYVGIFDMGSASGIYQRLAVGDRAVSQPGASLMFAKNGAGEIDSTAAETLNIAEKNLFAQVSPADWKKAVESAGERANERRPKIDVIVNNVKDDKDKSLIKSEKLASLVQKANLDKDPIAKQILQYKKTDELRYFLDVPGEKFVDKLLQAAVTP